MGVRNGGADERGGKLVRMVKQIRCNGCWCMILLYDACFTHFITDNAIKEKFQF